MIDEKQESIDRIVAKFKKKNIRPIDLDSYVHQTASNAASKINNEGLSAQVSFLILRGWTEKEIINIIPN